MSVVTLTLSWHLHAAMPSGIGGWRFEINGGNFDMSGYKFVRAGTSPYIMDGSRNLTGNGPLGWVLTPEQEPLLNKQVGYDTVNYPPLGFANSFLDGLDAKGYHVVSSMSIGTENGGFQNKQYIWTLHKKPQVLNPRW